MLVSSSEYEDALSRGILTEHSRAYVKRLVLRKVPRKSLSAKMLSFFWVRLCGCVSSVSVCCGLLE